MTVAGAEAVAVRFAVPADDERLAAIDDATWSALVSPAPRPAERAFFRPGVDPSDTLVAEVGDVVAGYALLGHPSPLPASAHVQMPAERPYIVLFAFSTASSGVRNVSTESTGPKISSCAIR